MSNPAPDRWGQSRVRAPVAREVAGGPEPPPPSRWRTPLAPVTEGPPSLEAHGQAVVADAAAGVPPPAATPAPRAAPAWAPPAAALGSPPAPTGPPPVAASPEPPRPAVVPAAPLRGPVTASMPGPTTASEPVPPPPPSRRRTGLLPASPADQEGLFRGLLWVARAVKECAAALPRLADRLGEVERRVVALAERPAPAAALGDRRDPEAAARLDAVEQRLQRLDALAQARAAGPPVETGLRDLRRDLATADRRLAAMELRLAPLESLPASVEELVARHVDRLATETLSLPADVEGVYRELDAVAEVMAARQAAASQSVRRIEALEAALAELRGRVAHLVEEHDDDAADRDHAGTAASVEPGPQPPAAAAPEVESPEGARRVLQVLTSELERIRQSIDVLVLDRGAASPGGGTFGA